LGFNVVTGTDIPGQGASTVHANASAEAQAPSRRDNRELRVSLATGYRGLCGVRRHPSHGQSASLNDRGAKRSAVTYRLL
jgi:hypothetical protein